MEAQNWIMEFSISTAELAILLNSESRTEMISRDTGVSDYLFHAKLEEIIERNGNKQFRYSHGFRPIRYASSV
ncbi:MAG: hypothetical protein AAB533_02255 [Patescibacteria group bacterium]